jgi:hypothetical protein
MAEKDLNGEHEIAIPLSFNAFALIDDRLKSIVVSMGDMLLASELNAGQGRLVLEFYVILKVAKDGLTLVKIKMEATTEGNTIVMKPFVPHIHDGSEFKTKVEAFNRTGFNSEITFLFDVVRVRKMAKILNGKALTIVDSLK